MRQNVVVKTKKTEVVRRDSDPKFNESLAFKVGADSLDNSSVVVAVWQSLTGQKGTAEWATRALSGLYRSPYNSFGDNVN